MANRQAARAARGRAKVGCKRLLKSFFTGLGDSLAAERDRWPLWCPVLLGVGIALYFAWPREPSLWIGGGAALAALAAMAAAPERMRWPAGMIFLLFLGFFAACLRAQLVAGPVLSDETRPVAVEAVVKRVERFGPRHLRLTLGSLAIASWHEGTIPRSVRIGVRTTADDVRAGDRVRLRAVLMPPPGPSSPGAYDFGRQAWFDRLGAVGYAVSPVTVTAPLASGSPATRLARLRDDIGRRLLAQTGGDAGAMAVALVTGDRSALSEQALEQLRIAGVAHLLAISGMHIALMTGVVFWTVRLLLACVPGLALRRPIKQWAAIAAMAAGLFYLLMSGATIPTQRAFLASWIVLAGILLDRVSLTMRLVAIAAAVLLLAAPESLLSVSFQMSFAAVTSLVAVYEAAREKGWLAGGRRGPLGRAGRYLAAVALTSVVAGAATGFFAAYHFNRFAVYGLAANVVAVPVMALVIMPCVALVFVALPFGLEAWPLWGVEKGAALVIKVAAFVASWPGADMLVPQLPAASLVLVVVGGLWLLLWRRRWRWWGVAAMAAGIGAIWLARPPDLLVDATGKVVAVRDARGDLAVIGGRRSFARETWLRRAAQQDGAEPVAADLPYACDALGCVYRPPRAPGVAVALVRMPDALAEDCGRARVVISAVPTFGRCRGPDVVVDRFDLWRRGPHALRIAVDGTLVRTVAGAQGDRPWSIYARRAARLSSVAAGRRDGPGS